MEVAVERRHCLGVFNGGPSHDDVALLDSHRAIVRPGATLERLVTGGASRCRRPRSG
jgi:hypothetical protein